MAMSYTLNFNGFRETALWIIPRWITVLQPVIYRKVYGYKAVLLWVKGVSPTFLLSSHPFTFSQMHCVDHFTAVCKHLLHHTNIRKTFKGAVWMSIVYSFLFARFLLPTSMMSDQLKHFGVTLTCASKKRITRWNNLPVVFV